MFFCALSMTASRSLSFCRFSAVCLVAVCIDWPRCCGDRIEPLVDRALQLACARPAVSPIGLQAAGGLGLDPRQVGELRVGLRCVGRPPRRGRTTIAATASAAEDEQARSGNGRPTIRPAARRASGGFVMRQSYRDSAAWSERRANSIRVDTSQRMPRPAIDRARSSPYIAAMARARHPHLPDKRLRLGFRAGRRRSTRRSRKLVEDMFETMYDAPGIGLAAIQIGVPQRVVIMDLAKKDEPSSSRSVFINPEILWASDEKGIYEEGCLSIPEFYEEVERPAQVKVEYLDLDGKRARDRGRRPARHLHPARDRSSQRRAVHRPYLQAQARPRDQEIQGQGGRSVARSLTPHRDATGGECTRWAACASSSWARRISRCRR